MKPEIIEDIKKEIISHSGTGEEIIQAYVDGLKMALHIIEKYAIESEATDET